MFESEIAINEMLSHQFATTAKDIPDEDLYHPSVGHGHPPVWIMGHLAITAEMGQRMLGGSVRHPQWVRLFGRGSSDIISPQDGLTKNDLLSDVVENYRKLREMIVHANPEAVSKPHTIEVFANSPVKTVRHCLSLILTSHFGFHLAQLSSCRRAAGFGPLF